MKVILILILILLFSLEISYNEKKIFFWKGWIEEIKNLFKNN